MDIHLPPCTYASPEQKYVELNFHRPETIETAVRFVAERNAPGLLVLEGLPGVGRSYFVEAVHYRLNRDGHTTRFARLDLDGHVPDDSTFADFAAFRREREPERADRIDAVAECLQACVDSTSGCALGLALSLYSDLELPALLDAYAHALARPRDERHGDRDLLWNLLAVLSDTAPLLLHIQNWKELQPVMWRWLVDATLTNENLVVAISACKGDVSYRDYPGKYAHVRLVFHELDTGELSRILDLRFPGLFPPDFDLGLGTVEDEAPCAADLMGVLDGFHEDCLGLPGVVANLIRDMIKQGFLVMTRMGWRWSREPGLFLTLTCGLFYSVARRSKCLPENPEEERACVLTFLRTAAVCGPIVPVAPIVHFPLELHESYQDWCRVILKKLGPEGNEHVVDGPYEHPGYYGPVFYLRNRAILHELRLSFSRTELSETLSALTRHPMWNPNDSRAVTVAEAAMEHLNPGYRSLTRDDLFWWFEYENAGPTGDLWNDLDDLARLCWQTVEEAMIPSCGWSAQRLLEMLEMRNAMDEPMQPENYVRTKAELLIQDERPDEAVQASSAYLDETETHHGNRHPRTGEAVMLLAETLRRARRAPEAGPLLSRAAAIFETALEPGHPRHLDALGRLAEWHDSHGAGLTAIALRVRIQGYESEVPPSSADR